MAAPKVSHSPNDHSSCNDHSYRMNGLIFYIGLGLGLALAAGVRPFLPALLAGALASSGALGVSFASGAYTFLYSDWWLVAVAAALVLVWSVGTVMRNRVWHDPASLAANTTRHDTVSVPGIG